MTPASIIREAQAEGVKLSLSPAGTIKVTGESAAVNRWLATIREHKAEIIDVLKVGACDTATITNVLARCQRDANAPDNLTGRAAVELPTGLRGAANRAEPFDREAFEERAAICEFEGGLNQEAATAVAWDEDDRRRRVQCANLTLDGICQAAAPSVGAMVVGGGF